MPVDVIGDVTKISPVPAGLRPPSPPGVITPPVFVWMRTLVLPDSEALMLEASGEVTCRSNGSSSHWPFLPFAAPASTAPPATDSVSPEVSTEPPLPPAEPPRALAVPAKLVALASTLTEPPSPLAAVAEASSTAPDATVVLAVDQSPALIAPPEPSALCAETAPETSTSPPVAVSQTWPFFTAVPVARMTPLSPASA